MLYSEYIKRMRYSAANERVQKMANQTNSIKSLLSRSIGADSGLTHSVTITVPGTTHKSIPLPPTVKAFVDNFVSEEFAGLFGGVTATAGKGTWQDENGQWVIEDVTLVTSYAALDDSEDACNKLQAVGRLADLLRDFLKQDCVLVSISPVTAVYFL